MYLIAIAWGYVVLMMGLAEAMSPRGTMLGALMTVLLYGVLPLSILLYILSTPHRRRARQAKETAESAISSSSPLGTPDRRGESTRDPVPSVREEP